jgi:putative phosphoesterase
MKLRRLGIIGDVHAEATHLEAALQFLQTSEVERIICTGDVVDGPDNADECCRLLETHQIITVRGNHDRWLLDGSMRDLPDATPITSMQESSLSFLKSLPVTAPIETVAGQLLLCHGMGENDMQGVTPDDDGYALQWKDELHNLIRAGKFHFVVAGHTHQRMVRRFEHLTVINAGTLYRTFVPCVSIVDFDSGCVEFHNIEGNTVTISQHLKLT